MKYPLRTVGAVVLVTTGILTGVALFAPWRTGSAQQPPHTGTTNRSTDAGIHRSDGGMVLSQAALIAQANDTDEELVDDTSDGGDVVIVPRFVGRVPSEPIAHGRDVLITAGEVLREVQDATDATRLVWAADPVQMEQVLDRMLADRLLILEARRLGLESDPTVRAALERALISRLRATVVNPGAGDGSTVTDADIQAFYDGHPERFHFPERRSIRVIFTPDRATAQRLLRQATARRHGHTADFRRLARESNTDPLLLRTNGIINDVTLARTDLDRNLRETTFAIAEEDEFSPVPVRGTWNNVPGFFVLRLNSIRKAVDRTLADEGDWIRQRLVLERRVAAEETLVRQLTQQAGVVRTPVDHFVQLVLPDGGVAALPDAGASDARVTGSLDAGVRPR